MSDYKDTNPKDAVGTKKAPISCIPMPFIFALGNALLEGARKYGRHNYRATGVRGSVYMDAVMRHMAAWWEGEDVDPDSGEHHIVKAAACLCVIYDSMTQGNWVDDRPPRPTNKKWLQEANRTAGLIVEKYDNPPDPYTEKSNVLQTDPNLVVACGGNPCRCGKPNCLNNPHRIYHGESQDEWWNRNYPDDWNSRNSAGS